jgi:hypothetical protein
LKLVVSSFPEGPCVESAWRVHSVRRRVPAAPDWEFATDKCVLPFGVPLDTPDDRPFM